MAQEQQKNDMKRINEVASKARDVQARFSERIKNLENKEFNSIRSLNLRKQGIQFYSSRW